MSIKGLFKPTVSQMKSRKNVRGLIKKLDDKNEFIRVDAIRALGDLGDKSAAVPLIQQIAKEGSSKRLNEITVSLGKICDTESLDLLISLLSIRSRPDDEFIRWAAVNALGRIGHEKVIVPLILELVDIDFRYLDIPAMAERRLLEIGQRSIPHLVQVLVSTDKSLYPYVRRGRLKGRIVRLLNQMGWKPKTEKEKLYYLFGYEKWKKIAEFGNKGMKILNEALDIFRNDIPEKYIKEALSTLQLQAEDIDTIIPLLNETDEAIRSEAEAKLLTMNKPECRIHLLENLFKFPRCYYKGYSDFKTCDSDFSFKESKPFLHDVTSYRSIFGDYTELILKIAGYKCYLQYYKFYYPLNENISSLKELCSIKTSLADNILFLVGNRKDVSVYKSADQYARVSKGTLSFGELRNLASEELERRKNPGYDTSVFLHKENWKIKRR